METEKRAAPALHSGVRGTPVACGWITDHSGVSWQIDPKMLIDLIGDPDPARVGKAMQVMMTMVKIDSEELKRAMGE